MLGVRNSAIPGFGSSSKHTFMGVGDEFCSVRVKIKSIFAALVSGFRAFSLFFFVVFYSALVSPSPSPSSRLLCKLRTTLTAR